MGGGNGNDGSSKDGSGGSGDASRSDGSGNFFWYGLMYAGVVGVAFMSRGMFFKEAAPAPAVAIAAAKPACCGCKEKGKKGK